MTSKLEPRHLSNMRLTRCQLIGLDIQVFYFLVYASRARIVPARYVSRSMRRHGGGPSKSPPLLPDVTQCIAGYRHRIFRRANATKFSTTFRQPC